MDGGERCLVDPVGRVRRPQQQRLLPMGRVQEKGEIRMALVVQQKQWWDVGSLAGVWFLCGNCRWGRERHCELRIQFVRKQTMATRRERI